MFGVGAWDVDLEAGKILNAKFHHMGIILFPSWLYKMTLASKAIFLSVGMLEGSGGCASTFENGS